MTTMFIQLRRVVYLLVLLQCCFCVLGEADNAVDEGTLREMRHTAARVQGLMGEAKKPLAEGEACRSVWREAVDSNFALVKKARSDVEVMGKLVDEFKWNTERSYSPAKSKYGRTQGQFGGEKVVKLRENVTNAVLKDLLGRLNAELEKEKGVPREEAAWSIEKTNKVTYFCRTALNGVESHLDLLNGTRNVYLTFGDDLKVEKWMEDLKEESGETVRKLTDLRNELIKLKIDGTRSLSEAKEQVKRWEEAMTELKLFSTINKEAEVRVVEPNDVEPKRERVSEENHNAMGKVVEKASTQKVEYGTVLNGTDAETIARRKEALLEANESMVGAIARAVVRIEEEEKKAADEKARMDREEEARRAAEEKERRAEEERRRVVEEEERRAEEERRRVTEEKAREEEKAKQDQERRDAEEKAREALEKKEKEQLERAAEEARKKAEAAKKNDNSVSPALVHNPLLLILLCVLGSTLVC